MNEVQNISITIPANWESEDSIIFESIFLTRIAWLSMKSKKNVSDFMGFSSSWPGRFISLRRELGSVAAKSFCV